MIIATLNGLLSSTQWPLSFAQAFAGYSLELVLLRMGELVASWKPIIDGCKLLLPPLLFLAIVVAILIWLRCLVKFVRDVLSSSLGIFVVIVGIILMLLVLLNSTHVGDIYFLFYVRLLNHYRFHIRIFLVVIALTLSHFDVRSMEPEQLLWSCAFMILVSVLIMATLLVYFIMVAAISYLVYFIQLR